MDVVDALEFGLLGDDTDVAHKIPACSQVSSSSKQTTKCMAGHDLHHPRTAAPPSPTSSPLIKAAQAESAFSAAPVEPSPKQAKITEVLATLAEALYRKEPNEEDVAILNLFNHRLTVVGATKAERRQEHLSAATRHLAEVVALSLDELAPTSPAKGIATGDAVSCDSKAAATSSAADVEDDVQCKAELTLRLFGKEESLCAREVPEEDEECRADLTQRLFGAGDSLGAPEDTEEDDACRADLTQRLFGHETLPMEVGGAAEAEVELDEQCREELTQRLFGKLSLPLEATQEEDDAAECRAELTQRLFGHEQLALEVGQAVGHEHDDECRAELTQRLFGHETLAMEVGHGEEHDEECKAELTQRLFGHETLPLEVGGAVEYDDICKEELTQRLFGREALPLEVGQDVLDGEFSQRLSAGGQAVLAWAGPEPAALVVGPPGQAGQGAVGAPVVSGAVDWSAPGLECFQELAGPESECMDAVEMQALDWSAPGMDFFQERTEPESPCMGAFEMQALDWSAPGLDCFQELAGPVKCMDAFDMHGLDWSAPGMGFFEDLAEPQSECMDAQYPCMSSSLCMDDMHELDWSVPGLDFFAEASDTVSAYMGAFEMHALDWATAGIPVWHI